MRDPMTNLPSLSEDVVQWLPRVPLYRGLSMAEVRLVASIAQEVRLEPGEYLTRTEDISTAVYVLYEGEMELVTPDQRRTRVIRPPEDYGLVSLVEPRRIVQATRALTPCRLVMVTADALHVLMDSDLSIGATLWRNIARLQTFHFMQLVDRWAGIEPRDTFNPYTRGM